MPFVVTESCIRCRYTDCVEVCPVDCFHEGATMLAIDPDECIDCGLCEPECPVNAICSEDELPAEQAEFLELNRKFAKAWPQITQTKGPLPEAEHWKTVKEKRQFLEEEGTEEYV